MISLKHEFKSRLRKLSYKEPVQNFICALVVGYMKLVYATSKKTYINYEYITNRLISGQSVIAAMWHGRILMSSYVAANIKKPANQPDKKYNFLVLASPHNDGKLVSKIMSKFGFFNVSGSSAKSGRGIAIASLREIVNSLKSGTNFVITPDGPRGPKHKIKGQVVNFAKISGVPILPFSYSASRFIKLKTWDEFMIPLPFSKLYYYFEDLIWVNQNASDQEVAQLSKLLEDKINSAMQKANQLAEEGKSSGK